MKRALSFVHSTFGRRIFVLFVICSLLPVCMLALVSLHRVSSRLTADSHERLRQTGKNAGMTLLEGFSLLQGELESMALPGGDISGTVPQLPPHQIGVPRFRSVTVKKYDPRGGVVAGMSRRLTPAAIEHLTAGNALLLAESEPGTAGPLYMATSVNRNLPGKSLLVGEINPEYLWTLVGYTQSRGIDICILAPSGKSLYASRPFAPPLVSSVMSHLAATSTGQYEWHGDDDDYLVNYWSAFLKPTLLTDAWTVVAIQSTKDVLGPAHSFIATFILVIFLTMLVVVFASSVLIRRSLVPLAILRSGADRLSNGDFDSRVRIASGDEFEDLATSFNDMSEHLGNQFVRLRGMGMLVQRILEARDRETILHEVIFHYCGSTAHEWIGISLVDADMPHQFRISFNNGSTGNGAKTVQFDALLSGEERNILLNAEDCLHVTAARSFTTLLAPLAEEGAAEFFLQPIHTKKNLLGVLILGYCQVPKQIKEELVRTRQVADEIAIALDNIRLIDELYWMNRGTLEVLANAVDAKSPWTAGHSQRVTRLALKIGKEMGLSSSDLELLQLAGMFHDIGKIGIPETILDKPGHLTDEEYVLIKKHPEIGAEMLKPIRAYHAVIPIVGQHHEQFDGLGYPQGLAGEEIVLGARIMAVADVFDALHYNRPYRQGWEISAVMSHMKEHAGSNFDPAVITALLSIDLASYLEPYISDNNPEYEQI
ncbi:MAG: HD domain-containing protein [Desulfuromonadaceae bacterium]|nr:HD domain-containing protein [Desulfuromonadaceae bacterium]